MSSYAIRHFRDEQKKNILEAKELFHAFGGCSPRGNHVGDSNENVAKQKVYLAEQ